MWEVARAVETRVMPRITAQHAGFAPWRFWRTVSFEAFRDVGPALPASQIPFEDSGRATLLTLAFEALGGVAPFLGLWLGALASLPLFLWVVTEFARAGRLVAGGSFLLLFASSAFVVNCLWWTHAAVGFYLLSLVLLAGVASYSILQTNVTLRGLLVRAVPAGVFFALSVACRASALLLLPGFVLALTIGSCRAMGKGALFRASSAVLFFLLPSLFVGTAHHHAAWMSLWEGLGDFDREKGHAFNDAAAILELQRAGIAMDVVPSKGYTRYGGLVSEEVERFFRTAVLNDIRDDPTWYARILVKRLWATIAQTKLWSWAPRAGRSFAQRSSANEGATDSYYRELASAHSFVFGPRMLEVPVPIVIAPTLALFLLASRRRRSALGGLLVVACCSSSALVAPILVTTASAAETEAFTVTYFLGAAFLLQEFFVHPNRREVSGRSEGSPLPDPGAGHVSS
jgi:hypothetical protein